LKNVDISAEIKQAKLRLRTRTERRRNSGNRKAIGGNAMGNLGSSLPALDIRPPAPPQNPLEEFSRVAQIKSQQQAQQAQSQEMQIRQQQIKDQQVTTAAMQSWDPSSWDYDGLAESVLNNGWSANAAAAIQKHGLDVKTAAATLDKD
jgi:hypothetical protein